MVIMRRGDLVLCKSDGAIGIIIDWLDPMYPRMVTVFIGTGRYPMCQYMENDLEVI